jgi:glycosyltransferase involved in cell wall biosynthesis
VEFVAVGRNPTAAVRRLREVEGVSVTGGVPDVRPYLESATAVVAPLRMARGIQNKVLEALAMGKRVFASAEVCATFAPELPHGLTRCDSPAEWVEALCGAIDRPTPFDPSIRAAARDRFSWDRNTGILLDAVEEALESRRDVPVPA